MDYIDFLITVISSSFLLIPTYFGMYMLKFRDIRRMFLYYLFSLYLCVVYWLTGPPDITYFRWDPGVSMIPLRDMVGDLRSTVLNIAMFLPLGIGLPLLWKKYGSFSKTVIFGLLTSLGIEVAQLFTYRATDINDLLTNVTGTALGYFVYKAVFRKPHTQEKDHAPLLLLISCIVMFFAEPFVYNVFYRLITNFINTGPIMPI